MERLVLRRQFDFGRRQQPQHRLVCNVVPQWRSQLPQALQLQPALRTKALKGCGESARGIRAAAGGGPVAATHA